MNEALGSAVETSTTCQDLRFSVNPPECLTIIWHLLVRMHRQLRLLQPLLPIIKYSVCWLLELRLPAERYPTRTGRHQPRRRRIRKMPPLRRPPVVNIIRRHIWAPDWALQAILPDGMYPTWDPNLWRWAPIRGATTLSTDSTTTTTWLAKCLPEWDLIITTIKVSYRPTSRRQILTLPARIRPELHRSRRTATPEYPPHPLLQPPPWPTAITIWPKFANTITPLVAPLALPSDFINISLLIWILEKVTNENLSTAFLSSYFAKYSQSHFRFIHLINYAEIYSSSWMPSSLFNSFISFIFLNKISKLSCNMITFRGQIFFRTSFSFTQYVHPRHLWNVNTTKISVNNQVLI